MVHISNNSNSAVGNSDYLLNEEWDEFIENHLTNFGTPITINHKNITCLASGPLLPYPESLDLIDIRIFKMNKTQGYTYDFKFFELLYLHKGRCTQTINGEKVSMNPGDLFLFSPSDKHSYEIEEDGSILMILLLHPSLVEGPLFHLLEDTLLQNYFTNTLFHPEMNQSFLFFPYTEGTRVIGLINVLMRECFEQNKYFLQYVESTLSSLFIELARSYQKTLEENVVDDAGFLNVINYIRQNKSSVTLESAAKDLGYHPNYLSKLIKQKMGKTFSEILLESKITEASFLLKNTDLPIEKIIKKVGFYDNSHFHRVFKKKYGVTPVAYRKSYQNTAEMPPE